jgi:glycosyltransferase involved in cell wall biosynthesis
LINKILFTGNFDPDYNRTLIIRNGLNKLGIETILLPFKKINHALANEIKLKADSADLIFLPAFTHNEVAVIKKLTSKPILFDPLISRYMTKVFDFKKVWRFSPRALKNFYKDKISMQKADYVLADTNCHKQYFHQKFAIPLNKIDVLPVGVDTAIFSPKPKQESNIFTVGFYGGFIPLQGVEKIVQAAELLKNEQSIHFHIAGSGFEFEKMDKLITAKNLKNITLSGWTNYFDLPNLINSFDICLGIFGDTIKADLVVPNKLFHYAACGKCIVTKETPAIKEIFTPQQNIILVQNTAIEIANAILMLKNNVELRSHTGLNAGRLVHEQFNETAIASKFLEIAANFMVCSGKF